MSFRKKVLAGHITGQPLGHKGYMEQTAFGANNTASLGHVRPVDMGHIFLKT